MLKTSDSRPVPHRLRHLAGACALLLVPFLAAPARAQLGGGDLTPPRFVTTPLLLGPLHESTPLVARIRYTTDEPTRAELVVSTGDRTFEVVAEQGYRLEHETLVLGLRPRAHHVIRLRVRDAAGNATEWPLAMTHTTPALPAAFPPLKTSVSHPTRMEEGLTLFSAFYSSPVLGGSGSFLIHLDAEGQVVWYQQRRETVTQLERMRNGNLLALIANREALEIDLLGNVVKSWWAANLGTAGARPGAVLVAADSFHHEFQELAGTDAAHFVALSTELRQFPNYPVSEVDTLQVEPVGQVAGDVIVEFRRDGSIVRELRLLDVLDPYRICYGSLAGFYNGLYGVVTRDWGHANAVFIDRSDDTWVVSLRHQDAVVKIRRSDGGLVWIHGAHDRWVAPWSAYLLTPIGAPFEWSFHQHGPVMDDAGRLTLFDNGNYRVIPPAVAPPASQWYSRAVTYHIDPVARTTRQLWAWTGGGQPFLSGFLGSADPLPKSGNVLVNEGSQLVPGVNKTYSRIREVTGEHPVGRVFEMTVNDPNSPAPSPYNWNVYRSSRVSALYPHL